MHPISSIAKSGACALFFSLMTWLTPSLAADAATVARFKGLEGTLNFAGGTAHIPVVQDCAKRIRSYNPKVRITVAGGGSGVGVQKLGEGLVDIGSTGRPLSQAEIERYGLRTFPFAIDGVAIVVNPANPVKALTASQVQAIYSGKVSNWKELGGKDHAIDLITRDEASGTREVFASKLLKEAQIAATASIVPSNGAVKTAVARDPNAIGYVSIGHVDASVKAIVLDGIAPTQIAARDGSYPVTRNLYFNTKGEPSPLASAFFDYLYGPEGAKIIAKAGYIAIPRKGQ